MTATQRQDFRFFHRLRVRWAEVDMQRIVFNAHYLMYFDTAMSDYWRALALPFDASMQSLGGDLYVKKASVEFHASARVDDLLDVALACTRIGTSSLLFTGAIFRGEAHLISAELIYVFADPATQTSKPVPPALRDIMQGYEANEPMVQVALGSWAALSVGARLVRTEVFLEEQRIPVEMEWDELDDVAVHAVARNRLGLAVGTARLLQHAPGVSRIGRMAVNRVLRGASVGRA
jgi:YbgC/YbaW family acyl-CoA thioester hydrolase